MQYHYFWYISNFNDVCLHQVLTIIWKFSLSNCIKKTYKDTALIYPNFVVLLNLHIYFYNIIIKHVGKCVIVYVPFQNFTYVS